MTGRGKSAARALLLGALISVSAEASAQFRIGVAAPLSGPDAVFGQQIRDGVLQAISDFNAAGGFDGQKATPVLADDQGNPQHSAEAASRLAREKITTVVGPFSSSAALAAAPVYAKAGIVEFLPAATSPGLTALGVATLFRLGSREDQQVQVAIRAILSRPGTRLALLHDRTNGGKAMADRLREGLQAAGVTSVFDGSIEKGAKDFASLATRIAASGATLVFWTGGPAEAGLLARQLHDLGAHVTLMGGTALAADEYATAAGPGADGTLVIFPQDPRQRPEAAALLQSLTARGIDPGAYTFYAYAAVEVLHQAAKSAKTLDPAAIAQELHSGTVFPTVVGRIGFDSKGDPIVADYDIFVWRKAPGGRLAFEFTGRS